MQKISLVNKSESVILEGPDGTEVCYTIQEYSGADEEKYLAIQSERYQLDAEGQPTTAPRDYSGVYSTLVHFTLRDPSGAKVPEATIKSWPARVQKALFEVASRVCGVIPEKELEKKD